MKKFLYFTAITMVLFSCKKDEEEITPEVPVTLGFYVLNEGAFQQNNASISYLATNEQIQSDPYFDANGVPLGDVLQSYVSTGNLGYAVLNNSNKIEVFNKSNWENVATIEGINYPRYIVNGPNGKLYVSAGSFAGSVHVINPISNTVEATIAVGNGPERMLVHNGKLYVCNSGGWLEDNTVSVIDLATNSVVSTITVGDRPMDIDIDADNVVWVLCSGKTVWNVEFTEIIEETAAQLVKIDATNNDVLASGDVGVIGDHPKHMEIGNNSNTLYYLNNKIYSFNTAGGELPGTVLIDQNFNSLDLRDGEDLWLTSIPNFTTSSTLFCYSLSGSLLNQWTAGIGTNGVVFF
jgi:YVTN family beta-propeller protein